MNVLFFALLAVFLIIVQSIVLPAFSWFSLCFDLGIINIIFLSLSYTHYGALGAIVFLGLIMDSISGCAFFFHTFSYVWIYLIIQMFKQLVFLKSAAFVLMISVVSVLIEHALILFSIFLVQGRIRPWDFSLMAKQTLLAMVVIPPSLWILNHIQSIWRVAAKTIKKQFILK